MLPQFIFILFERLLQDYWGLLGIHETSRIFDNFSVWVELIVFFLLIIMVDWLSGIIGRHIELEANEESESFLKDRLGVPAQWIEQARGVKARYCSEPRLEARSLLAAGLYTEAHDVICDGIAPEAILSESYQQLEDLLAPLAQPQRCSLIADWSIKGKVYWNYMTVVKAVDNILKQVLIIFIHINISWVVKDASQPRKESWKYLERNWHVFFRHVWNWYVYLIFLLLIFLFWRRI